jgi:hypothetical protein
MNNTTTKYRSRKQTAAGNLKPRVPQVKNACAGGLAAGLAASRAAGHVWMRH